MTQAVTRQGLGIAASNLLLAAMYLIFAYIHLTQFAATARPSMLLIVASESLLVVFVLIRRDPDATWHSWWTWLTMLGGTFGPLLLRPVAAADDLLVGQAVQIAGLVLEIAAIMALSRSFGLLPAHRGVESDGLPGAAHPQRGSLPPALSGLRGPFRTDALASRSLRLVGPLVRATALGTAVPRSFRFRTHPKGPGLARAFSELSESVFRIPVLWSL